jgi:hypothetical protein
MKYREKKNIKTREENTSLRQNHVKLQLPPPNKIKTPKINSIIPLWVQGYTFFDKIYCIKYLNEQIWIKHYNNITKIFTLRKNSKISRK